MIETADKPTPAGAATEAVAGGPDWLRLARDAHSASTTYFDASIRRQAEGDLRQFQGLHPHGSKYLAESNRSRSRLFRPKTRAAMRKNEAIAAEAFFSTVDVVAVSAQDDNNPVQQASAAVMQQLLQYRLTKTIPWFQTVIGAYQDALTVGTVVSYQYWEFNPAKKIDRPCICLVPLENFRFDPGSHWADPVGTSPYLIELLPMYVKDVRARMKGPDSKTAEAAWHPLPDEKILSAIRQYGDSIRLQREAQRTDSKDQAQAVSDFSVVWVHRNIVEVDGIDWLFYTLGTEELLSDPVPLEQVHPHGKRPYVVGSCVIETHKNYPSSPTRLAKDVQAEINDVANLRIDNLRLALNKRYFVKRSKQVDIRSLTRNVPGSVTLMTDPKEDVEVVEFSDVTASSYKEQEVLNLDFDDVTGTFSGSSVQSNRKLNETVGGMELLSSGANQVAGYQLRTFVETWVEPVLRQVVLLEQFYETDDVLLALAGTKAAIAEKFGVNQVTDDLLMQELTLNVNVGMGAVSPTDQVTKFMQGMTSLRDLLADGVLLNYGLKVDEVISELFGKLGYRDGSRFFDFGNEDPQVQALHAMVQQLQQQLAAKQPPELVEAQVRKINAEVLALAAKEVDVQAAAVKKGVEAAFSAMQAAEVLAAVPQVAPIADKLMEGAGYKPPAGGGADPNFPQIPGQGTLGIEPVGNPKTGISFTPGTPDTTPSTPADPASAGQGAAQGIETMAADSTGAQPPPGMAQSLADGGTVRGFGYADGGLLDEPVDIDGLTATQRLAMNDLAAREPGNYINPTGAALSAATGLADGQPVAAQSVRMPSLRPPAAPEGMFADPSVNFQPPPQQRVRAPRPQSLVEQMVKGASREMRGELNAGLATNLDHSMLRGFKPFDGAMRRPLLGFSEGGKIVGPGSGTSDSVPAVNTDTGQPVAVSNGEMVIPADVVQALGEEFFNELIDRFHSPVNEQGSAQ